MANLQRVNTKQMTHDGQNTVYDLMNQIAGENLVINGNFDIWHRGQTQSTPGYGSADRWFNSFNGSSCTLSSVAFTGASTEVVRGSYTHMRANVTSVTGVSNQSLIVTRLEHLKYFLNRTFTLSFWAKADASKNMSVEFIPTFSTGEVITAIGVKKFALTTSWKKYSTTVTIPSSDGKTFGVNDCLQIAFWFDAGTNLNVRTDSLGHQSGVFDIAQVKFENGAVATPFVPRSYSEEIRLCERYYQLLSNAQYGFGLHGYTTAGGSISQTILFRTRMRTIPSIVLPAMTLNNTASAAVGGQSQFGFLLYAVATATGAVSVLSTGATNGYAEAEI